MDDEPVVRFEGVGLRARRRFVDRNACAGDLGVNVAPSGGDTFLATNVAAVRFSFPNQEATAGGYRELDVFGAVVPEPSTGLLLALGLGGLGLRSRRAH